MGGGEASRRLFYRGMGGRGRRGSLVDNFVAVGDDEFCSGRLVAIDVGNSDDLLAGAGIVVFDDEVDEEVGRIPVLVCVVTGWPVPLAAAAMVRCFCVPRRMVSSMVCSPRSVWVMTGGATPGRIWGRAKAGICGCVGICRAATGGRRVVWRARWTAGS